MLVHAARRRAKACRRALRGARAIPRRRTATVSITGTPSSRSRAARIELEPVALGEVDHVERDDRRQPERDQLQREAQMIVEVGGVEHDHQRIGLALALPGGRAGRRA